MRRRLKTLLLFPNILFAGVITNIYVTNFGVDKARDCVYAFFSDNTLRRTCNNGVSWSVLTKPPIKGRIRIDSKNQIIYVDAYLDIYYASLRTMQWRALALPSNVGSCNLKHIDISNGKIYLCRNNRLYFKEPGGARWQSTSSFPSGSQIQSWEVLENGTIFLGDYNFKIYRSTDNGRHWQDTGWMTVGNHDLPDSSSALIINPDGTYEIMASSPSVMESVNGILFAGSYAAGVHMYANSHWYQISRPPFPAGRGAFTLAPVSEQVIYAQPGAYGFGDIPVHPVYRTINQGQSWEKVDKGMYYQIPKYGDPLNIQLFGADSGRVYARVNDGSLYSIKYPEKAWHCLVNHTKPIVETADAQRKDNSVVLEGVVYPNGEENTVWFEYGSDSHLGESTSTSTIKGASGAYKVSHEISLPSDVTTLYFRIVSLNKNGKSYGRILKKNVVDVSAVLPALLAVLEE